MEKKKKKKALFNKIFSLWVSLVLLLQQGLELEQHVEGLWVGWEGVAASLCCCAGAAKPDNERETLISC